MELQTISLLVFISIIYFIDWAVAQSFFDWYEYYITNTNKSLRGVIIIKKKNKKETKYIYTEKFITNNTTPTEEELKMIFNKKYFEYIKRRESRTLGG